ncbi:unnamed protein product [Closterium sp. NIES-64]|nr:unnamed protein product [Closterium sp. NIES-64]
MFPSADGEAGLAEAEGEKAWWAQGWDVPWGWRETGIGMSAWISSFIFEGIAMQNACLKLGWAPWRGTDLAVQLACLKLGWAPWRGTDLNDEALFLLINHSCVLVPDLLPSSALPPPPSFIFVGIAVQLACLKLGFIFVGIAVQLTCLKLGWAPWRGTDLNDEALFLLINQSVRTASGIAIVWFVARPFNPLSTDLFHWGRSIRGKIGR